MSIQRSKSESKPFIRGLRAELKWLRARYDDGAISTAVFTVLKRLECDIAWAEHEARRMQS
jgi:hypothetical protein